MTLVWVLDLARQFGERVRTEKETIQIDVWWIRIPLLPRNRIHVEDRPDWPAAVWFFIFAHISVRSHRRMTESIRFVHFVPEPQSALVNEDHILPGADGQTGSAGLREH